MELNIIRAIQMITSPIFDTIFTVITMFGGGLIAVAICTWMYWCNDKHKGIYIIYSMVTSVTLNNIVKGIFKMPRPIGQEGIISKQIETATGYSFPSGHTQSTTTFWTAFSILTGKKIIYIISVLAVILVGLSRLYLGLHYPKDILGGLILGLIVPLVSCVIFEKFKNAKIIALVTAIPLSFGLLFAQSPDYFKAYGLYIGFLIGLYLESSINFRTPLNMKSKIFRYILGIVMLIGLQIGLHQILPDMVIFDMIRYMILSIFVVGIYPMIFKYFKF